MSPVSPRRIAIVGLGPKGMYCLERLADQLPERPRRRAEIHLFEPHPYPGAGPVYDPTQPRHLRMNYANRHVDMWWRNQKEESAGDGRPDFLNWVRARNTGEGDPEGYAPRAMVGEYLHEGFEQIRGRMSRRADVSLHQRLVTRAVRCDGGWSVQGDFDPVEVDELLLTTGHLSRSAQARPASHPRVVPGVYPVDRYLSPERIPEGSVVAVRGFGLTALDAALTLARCSVSSIIPFSRSGRPMVPKLGTRALRESDLTGIWRTGSERLKKVRDASGIKPLLVETAGRALRAVRGGGESRTEVILRVGAHLAWLTRCPSGRYGGEGVEEALERGLEIARGHRVWGTERALGEAWRNLYPAVVEVVATGVVSERQWPSFNRLTGEMERLAFGPPLVVMAEVLELVRSGVVDLSLVDGPRVDIQDGGVRLSTTREERFADVLVDAVLDPPGAAPGGSPLLQGLLSTGQVRVVPGTCGIEVRCDGSAIGRTGAVTPGLAVIGRPTEGTVLGNDTLSRGLHGHPTRWAERIGAGIRARGRIPA